MKSLCGKFEGHRCFLIGNGPSLSVTPLERLIDEYTFGVNSIAQFFPNTAWRPWAFVVAHGEDRDAKAYATFQKAIDVARYSFTGMEDPLRGNNLYRLPMQEYPSRDGKKNLTFWSWSPTHLMNQRGGVSFVALQIACYMGFNPIYLLGIDHTHPNEHFCADYWAGIMPLPHQIEDRKRRVENSFRLALEITRQHGIDVYDATIGGGLNVFPKVKLEDVLS